MIRPRGATTRWRDEPGQTNSAEEIGRLLRDAREERGLDLLAVHDRLSRPITQLEALEHGDLGRLPDQALALSTLRRYAAFLGLDGDALALRMIDAWSAMPPAPSASRRDQRSTEVTGVTAAVTSGPEHLRAFTQTGQVPRIGGGSTAAIGGNGLVTGPPTGTFPVVPRQELKHSRRAVAKARRRLRAPTSLKVVTWVTVILLLVAVAGFGIYQWRPQWLVTSHILRVAQPSGSPGAGPATTGGGELSNPVAVVSTGGQTTTYTVATKVYNVVVITNGPCWVQVTSSSSSSPLVVGVQPTGKLLTLPAKGTMTVQVGSSAVLVGITIKGKTVFYNKPQTTPYTYIFGAAPNA